MQPPEHQLHQNVAHVSWLVLLQELRSLVLSPALWVMFIIVSLLTGYSFIQAVNLFSQASLTALKYPELATGMNPLQGIFVPTFGAYYLSQTLLLPFIAIRSIGLDRYTGTQKLLLQLPLTPMLLCLVKLTAMIFVWLLSLLPGVLALVLWQNAGGHIYWPALSGLIAGHGLYSFTIITLAMFVATVSDSLPTAAMLCLAATLGSWVLDFAITGKAGFGAILNYISLAGMLRQFETGLLSSAGLVSFLSIGLFFFCFTVIWLPPWHTPKKKTAFSILIFFCFVLINLTAQSNPQYVDLTENRQHSFSPQYSRALHKLNKPLYITVHLTLQDSRLLDLKKDVLGKLQRTVSQLVVHYDNSGEEGLFTTENSEQYGLIVYRYGNRKDKSYSNSQEEILPLIFNLAGIQPVREQTQPHKGYPLVTRLGGKKYLFYCALPLFFAGCAVFFRKTTL